MGIRGLTYYMMSSSYLEDYELQNTDLVIDGSNLFNELLQHSDWHPAFGGDYDKFDRTVSDFFDCLLECNVKPLVLFHGSCTESQMPTFLARLRERIEKSLTITPETPKNEQGHSLFLKHVFVQCLKEKDIPLAQCQFDVDNSIAAIANALNCPVLANASYYYLYGAVYIPNAIKNVMDHLNDNRKTIPCKIYRLERLLNRFQGLNHHTLSLIDVLMSNNNRKLEPMVSNTIALIKKEHVANCEKEPSGSILITKTLNWLRKYTLEDAIAEIIKGAPPPMRPELLKIIETNINKYTNPFSEAFTHLMIPEECFSSPTKELYRFKGNIETLPYRAVHDKENVRLGEQRDNYVMQMSNMLLNQTGQHHKDSLINKLPQWFKHEYSLVNFPEYALCLMRYHFRIYPSLFEDSRRPPSCQMAEKIFQFVYHFLISVTQVEDFTLNVVKRVGRGFKVYRCDIPRNLIESPAVIKDLSHSARKKIIDIALGIQHIRFIDALLPEWQLYIASLRYWRTHARKTCDKFHMYSMLTCLIYKLTTSKIEYYNSLSSFENANSSVIKLLQEQRDKSNIEPKYSTIVTVAEACMEIDTLDCLLAAPFFISHSQHVLVASMDLNALLDWPYKEPKIANLYNENKMMN
ncbi:protein asteroid-like [Lasioglossum baleicum]|uniref:protein asteroid-like n=1 Tax=Lasioglossum baleicum TaxID=434251 RepID=UPI003FCD0885